MSEKLTFDNFSPLEHGREAVYRIGASDGISEGVAKKMANAFSFKLTDAPEVENINSLIDKIAKDKLLQNNIEAAISVLGENAINITRDWAISSGLLIPVERSYLTAERIDGDIDLAIISGGMRNWMERRASRLIELNKSRKIGAVLLVGGNRIMKVSEGPDVIEGMTEADYMQSVVAARLGDSDISSEIMRVDSGKGIDVMRGAVEKSSELVDMANDHITVVSNAGIWPQNGGQYLHAATEFDSNFNKNPDHFEVVSDSFELGVTGNEPSLTHQNPISAIGAIARNLYELTRHSL